MLRRLLGGIARKSISGSTASGILPSVSGIAAVDLNCATASSRVAYRQRTFLHSDRELSLPLYEGFMDWLSALALGIGHAEDSLVLNSVANADKAIPALENYHEIVCHLDHDEAGRRTVGVLRKRFGERVADHSGRYSGYKDLNEYLVAKQKISNHQNKE